MSERGVIRGTGKAPADLGQPPWSSADFDAVESACKSCAGLSADVTRLEAAVKEESALKWSARKRAQESDSEVAELRSALEAAVAGLELARGVHAQVNMDSPEDSAAQTRAVETMTLAVDFARKALARLPLSGSALQEALGAAEVRVKELEAELVAHSAEGAEMRVDGWGERLDAERLREVVAAAPQGSDWWFDGRDLFYKPEGTNLDQIIIPLPETWHESQAVPQAVGVLVAMAVNHLRASLRSVEGALPPVPVGPDREAAGPEARSAKGADARGKADAEPLCDRASCRLCSQGIACNVSALESPLDKLLTALSEGRHHDAYDLGMLAETELETLRGLAATTFEHRTQEPLAKESGDGWQKLGFADRRDPIGIFDDE